jgi:uncharacterized protein
MKRHPYKLAPFLFTVVLFAAIAQSTQAAELAGHWKGAINVAGGELAIVVTVTQGSDRDWTGTIDIPAQGLRGFELSGVAVEGTQVHFEMAGIPGQPTFDGELSASGDSIDGSFRQGPQMFPFSLQRMVAEIPEGGSAATSDGVPGDGAVGAWLGALHVGQMTLRLGLQVEEHGEDTFTAILDSIDQGSKISFDSVVFEDRKLRLGAQAIGASYEGTLNADGSALEGVWSQGGRELPLTFLRQKEVFALNRPQHPRGPFPYESHEVTFRSDAGNVRLEGTFIVPEGDGPFPAVAMVTGSGPQDRDETVMGHKPFLVIADALARRGIASLRWDDRGAGKSGGDHFGSTVDEFAADARAAVSFLSSRPEVNASAVGIVGHSEGGLTGPMVAVGNESVAFLVLLAPPGEPMRSLLPRQARDLYRLRRLDEELIDRALMSQAEDLELVADATMTAAQLEETLRERVQLQRERFTDEERTLLGIDRDAIERSIQLSTTPWFRSLIRQDPAFYLRDVTVPVLALFGEKDFQVDAGVNAAAVRAALGEAGNSDYEVQILSGLNHLFQHAETGGMEEYGVIEETFAPAALERIGAWIEVRFGRPVDEPSPTGATKR